MKEFKAIIDAYRAIDFSKQMAALATVVKVSGSSYRSPGARMLITDNGKWIGSISGGCLEGDALRKARQVMQTREPVTVTYDTREESNQNLGIGLGCNGVIDVLIEPVVPDGHNPIRLFEELTTRNAPHLIATVYRGSMLAEKVIMTPDGDITSRLSDEQLTDRITHDLFRIYEGRKTESREYQSPAYDVEVFLELVAPNIKLMIFGAGFDARPVSQFAKMLGWDVEVTDECVAHIAPVFFPDADKLSLCDRKFIDRDFQITPYTACVLMSHNYEYDRDVLKKLLDSQTPYIGILGPRKRFDKMLSEFKEDGIALSSDRMDTIHSPIGLDIGAETPDEIALSIVSEIKSRFSSRSGGFLKYRRGPIHLRDPRDGQIFRQIFVQNSDDQQATG